MLEDENYTIAMTKKFDWFEESLVGGKYSENLNVHHKR